MYVERTCVYCVFPFVSFTDFLDQFVIALKNESKIRKYRYVASSGSHSRVQISFAVTCVHLLKIGVTNDECPNVFAFANAHPRKGHVNLHWNGMRNGPKLGIKSGWGGAGGNGQNPEAHSHLFLYSPDTHCRQLIRYIQYEYIYILFCLIRELC